VESDVDAREAGPGPVSRLCGANGPGRDGVRELRGLCHRRGRGPAQPSLRARPRESAEAVRCRLPPYQATAGPGSGRHLGEGRGRSPVHLHELRRLVSEAPPPNAARPAAPPKPSETTVRIPAPPPKPAPASPANKTESAPTPSPAAPVPSKPAPSMPADRPVAQTRRSPAQET